MTKKSRKYWQKRMTSLEDGQYKKSQKYYDDMQKQYGIATNNIQIDIEHWYMRLADNNDISYTSAKQFLKKSEMEEFYWTVERYIEEGRKNNLSEKWMKQLENASAQYHISYLEAMKFQIQQHAELLANQFHNGMTEFLTDSFTNHFYKTAYEIAKGSAVGVNLTKWNSDRVETIIKTPWAQDGKNFSDRIWNNKERLLQKLHTELTQYIIRGESPDKAIKNLSKAMEVSKKQAGRLIMTESAAIASIAQKKCFEELSVKEYEVVETLDSHTCLKCQDMDGLHFPMKEFAVGITAPPFHPCCRGCTCPYFHDEFTEGEERAVRDSMTGKTNYVPSDLTYKDWYQKYVVAGDSRQFYTMGIQLPEETKDIKGFTAEVREQIETHIQKMQEHYDIRIGSITTEGAGAGDIFITGYYDGKMGIVINSNADFERIIKRIPQRYGSGFLAGKTLDDYVSHELFHVMAYQDCASNQVYAERYRQMESLFDSLKGISGYADKSQSGNEALAEAFVRIQNNEEVPQLAKILVESYIGRWRK